MSTIESDLPRESNMKPWVITVTAAMFLLYEFIQMNMFSSINQDLIVTFHIGPRQLGLLSSSYFLANLIFLLPAAQLLDRFSPRILILGTMSLCILGTVLFASSTTFRIALYCRFATGIGSAFCFLGAIRIASRWFSPDKMALPSGIIVLMAMTGGLLAQYPFSSLVSVVGWRHALYIDAGFGSLILLAIMTLVHDHPDQKEIDHNTTGNRRNFKAEFQQDIATAYLRTHNWFAGLFTCLLNLPIFILGGLYGTLFLHQVHHFSRTDSSIITLALFVGALIGSPLAGYISDQMGRRLIPMRIGAIVAIPIILAILYIPDASMTVFILLFFALGLISSAQIISYPFVNETNPTRLTASATSAISICCIGSGYIVQPLVGYLIEWHTPNAFSAETVYSHQDYTTAFSIIPIGFLLALLCTYLLRESYCKRRQVNPSADQTETATHR